MKDFINSYLERMAKTILSLDSDNIEKIILMLEACHHKNGTIYVIGNGGSSATASHMANDFSVGLKLRGIRNFNIVSLADNVPVCTAIANDIGYENIFYAQLVDKLTPDDVVIAISCSGNSPNIVKASRYAIQVGSALIGLTGFDGGELKQICNINYHVNTEKGDYGIVEDVHMILDHIIYSYYISLKPENKSRYVLR
ncbi:SIS domain-containing protein [Aeromonas veronii]|uniref:SIS domain-containing protein n=1 Tax=Aeromonas TaxID=642 RepID=UPI0003F8B053|nr:SIS domain-containing protein [Aeromonas veronii]MCF5911236.1 SIS domain-containing protein [Aeromonas veronii]QMS78067.1 SIS domain-containing protein [Aeromonas veronii Hm21]TNI05987.1 sugar isomerase [Aeromonas veronii]TNI51816.1 sugar isomerase [Aeromonas veronii]TNI54725.1 sugar isomerase [Aeromonas veronii]